MSRHWSERRWRTVRYGYRRVHVQLRREGWEVNHKRIHRLYNEMGLQLRNKSPKRRVKAKLRENRCEPTQANETWAMDFVHDQLATGRKLRVLTIVYQRSLMLTHERDSQRVAMLIQHGELKEDRHGSSDRLAGGFHGA